LQVSPAQTAAGNAAATISPQGVPGASDGSQGLTGFVLLQNGPPRQGADPPGIPQAWTARSRTAYCRRERPKNAM